MRVRLRDAEGFRDLRRSRKIKRDALALMPVHRFDDDRRTQLVQRCYGLVQRFHYAPARHGKIGLLKNRFGQFLVARDFDGDAARLVSHGGLYELAIPAVARSEEHTSELQS